LTPRKSLNMKLPDIPSKFFGYFLRGYFDGDGCVNVSLPKGRKTPLIQVIFTSGSEVFLQTLSQKLSVAVGIACNKVHFNSRAFRLKYRKINGLKILSYMYKDLQEAPFLDRKYAIYKDYLDTLKTNMFP